MKTDYIKVTMTLKLPKDKMTPEEQKQWPKSFEELQREMQQTTPGGCIVTMKVEEVTE